MLSLNAVTLSFKSKSLPHQVCKKLVTQVDQTLFSFHFLKQNIIPSFSLPIYNPSKLFVHPSPTYLQVVTLFSFTFYLPSGLEGLPGHIVIVLLSQRENGRQERLITLTIEGQSISQVSTKQKQKYLKKNATPVTSCSTSQLCLPLFLCLSSCHNFQSLKTPTHFVKLELRRSSSKHRLVGIRSLYVISGMWGNSTGKQTRLFSSSLSLSLYTETVAKLKFTSLIPPFLIFPSFFTATASTKLYQIDLSLIFPSSVCTVG